jgi:DNA-binding protein YbaB
MNKTTKQDLIKQIRVYDKSLSENDIEIIDNLLIQAYNIIKTHTLTKSHKSLTNNQLYLQYETK